MMQKNIFLLLFTLFSVTSVASQFDVNCGPFGYFYRLKQFTLPNETEPTIGLVNSDNLFQKNQDGVLSKVYTKNIETGSIYDKGLVVGGKNPIADIAAIPSSPVDEEFNGRFLREIFKCFCKINPNVLNNCTMYVSYDAINCGPQKSNCDSQKGYNGLLTCINGSIVEESGK